MPSIADMLGVQWNRGEGDGEYHLHPHATKQATLKGINPAHVLHAANDPKHTYDNGRYPGQKRHVRDGIVAVVDPARKEVLTVYKDQEETAIRPDQTDKDARRYAKNRATVGGAH